MTVLSCQIIPWNGEQNELSESDYHKVASPNTSRLEAHKRLFQIACEGDFGPLCTVTFWKKIDFLISNASYNLQLGIQ